MSELNNETSNTQVAILMPNLFGDVDFKTLDDAITALGQAQSAQPLKTDEKEHAVNLIDEWNNDVVGQLEAKASNARQVLIALDTTILSVPSEVEDVFESLAMQSTSDVQDLYEEYSEMKKEKIKIMRSKPLQPESSLATTVEDKIDIESEYQKELKKYQVQIQTVNAKIEELLKELKIMMSGDEKVQEFEARVRKYVDGVDKFKYSCKNKASVAKVMVGIESGQMRDALSKLFKFSAEI